MSEFCIFEEFYFWNLENMVVLQNDFFFIYFFCLFVL